MINSVSFGSSTEQKNNKSKNTIIGGVVGAGAGLGTAALVGKKPIADSASKLVGLENDKFESTMKAVSEEGDKADDIKTAKTTIKEEKTAVEERVKDVDDKIKTIFGEGDAAKADIPADDAVKNMKVDANTVDELKTLAGEDAEKKVTGLESKAETYAKEAEGIENSKEKEIHFDKEGKLVEKAGDETETVKLAKDADGKVTVHKAGGETSLEQLQKEAATERKAFDVNKSAFSAVDGKEKITKDEMKAIFTDEAKVVSEKADDAFKTIKDSIPKKLATKTAAIYTAAGAIALGLIANLATKKPEGAE